MAGWIEVGRVVWSEKLSVRRNAVCVDEIEKTKQFGIDNNNNNNGAGLIGNWMERATRWSVGCACANAIAPVNSITGCSPESRVEADEAAVRALWNSLPFRERSKTKQTSSNHRDTTADQSPDRVGDLRGKLYIVNITL